MHHLPSSNGDTYKFPGIRDLICLVGCSVIQSCPVDTHYMTHLLWWPSVQHVCPKYKYFVDVYIDKAQFVFAPFNIGSVVVLHSSGGV